MLMHHDSSDAVVLETYNFRQDLQWAYVFEDVENCLIFFSSRSKWYNLIIHNLCVFHPLAFLKIVLCNWAEIIYGPNPQLM